MKTIAILNQKGGAGKTTLATNLARAFQFDGQNVLLVDSDPQGSARDWGAANENQTVPVVGLDRPSLDRDLKAVASNHSLVIVDGAPQIKELAVAAIKAADLVLIPVQPSPYDIWAAQDLVDLVKARMEIMDGRLQVAFVVSRAIRGTRIGGEVVEALEGFGLPVLSTQIHQRIIYPSSAARGLSVLDCRGEQGYEDAASEIKALAAEILGKLV